MTFSKENHLLKFIRKILCLKHVFIFFFIYISLGDEKRNEIFDTTGFKKIFFGMQLKRGKNTYLHWECEIMFCQQSPTQSCRSFEGNERQLCVGDHWVKKDNSSIYCSV